MDSTPDILSIRLGYGPARGEVTPQALAADLAGATTGRAPDLTTIAQRLRDWQAAKGTGDEAPLRADLAALPVADMQARVARALSAPIGFGERMVQFWADHFTVRAKNLTDNLLVTAFVDHAIRPHLTGRFADMLVAAVTHPAMVGYLDQGQSAGPGSPQARRRAAKGKDGGLNENLAREVIELHTLGVGASYGQGDVRELAELFTGLTFQPGRGGPPVRFRPQMAEPGADTVLGETYGGRGTDGMAEIARALGDLAAHPATVKHLSRKLVTHVLTDDPTEAQVEVIAAVWRDTGGDLGAVHTALAAHPDLGATFRQKVRQPFDYLIAALRALGVTPAQVASMDDKTFRQTIHGPAGRMGQPWGQPLGPDGWAESAGDWITPQGLAARIDWAMRMPRRLIDPLPDPRDWLTVALGTTASAALTDAVPRAETAREGVGLILASTEFNRR